MSSLAGNASGLGSAPRGQDFLFSFDDNRQHRDTLTRAEREQKGGRRLHRRPHASPQLRSGLRSHSNKGSTLPGQDPHTGDLFALDRARALCPRAGVFTPSAYGGEPGRTCAPDHRTHCGAPAVGGRCSNGGPRTFGRSGVRRWDSRCCSICCCLRCLGDP